MGCSTLAHVLTLIYSYSSRLPFIEIAIHRDCHSLRLQFIEIAIHQDCYSCELSSVGILAFPQLGTERLLEYGHLEKLALAWP